MKPPRPAAWRWAVPLVIALVTVVAFLPALQNGFVNWDDLENFLDNPRFRGLGVDELGWMWTTTHLGHYVPLTWMTLGLDYLLWGMNPTGYHLTSLLLHAANAVLLYFVARRILGSSSTGPIALAAAFTALLFSLHPLRVESVAWATERRDVLSGFFSLLSVLCYLRRHDASDERSRRRWYALALVAALAALLSKAVAATLPAVLLLLDVYPLRRLGGSAGWWTPAARRVFAEKLPFLLIAAAASILARSALGQIPQLEAPGKIAVSAWSFGFYLWKTLVPLRLSPLYPMPERIEPLAPRFLLAYAVIAALALVLWKLRGRTPGAVVALLAWAVILLPLLGLVQNGPQIAADRYTYQASPALALLGGAGVLRLHALRPGLARGLAVALLLALGGLTWKQTGVWRDSGTLWRHALALGIESPIAHANLGNELVKEGRLDDALAEYRQAIALDPEYAKAEDNWGLALVRLGRPDEAIAHHRRAATLEPERAEFHNNWGVALAMSGRTGEAIEQYRLALEARPEYADARINWGNALVREGRTDEAIAQYRAALDVDSRLPDAHHNWGVALARRGDLAGAIEQFRRALAIRPDHAEAREYLEQASRMLDRQRSDSLPRR